MFLVEASTISDFFFLRGAICDIQERRAVVMGITCTSLKRVDYLMVKGFRGSSNFKIK